jgi:hypothetical protein
VQVKQFLYLAHVFFNCFCQNRKDGAAWAGFAVVLPILRQAMGSVNNIRYFLWLFAVVLAPGAMLMFASVKKVILSCYARNWRTAWFGICGDVTVMLEWVKR